MDTDEHGLRQGKWFLQQTQVASLIGKLVCIAEILFPIRVYLCPSVVKEKLCGSLRSRRLCVEGVSVWPLS
jgi:hypothetical protein